MVPVANVCPASAGDQVPGSAAHPSRIRYNKTPVHFGIQSIFLPLFSGENWKKNRYIFPLTLSELDRTNVILEEQNNFQLAFFNFELAFGSPWSTTGILCAAISVQVDFVTDWMHCRENTWTVYHSFNNRCTISVCFDTSKNNEITSLRGRDVSTKARASCWWTGTHVL